MSVRSKLDDGAIELVRIAALYAIEAGTGATPGVVPTGQQSGAGGNPAAAGGAGGPNPYGDGVSANPDGSSGADGRPAAGEGANAGGQSASAGNGTAGAVGPHNGRRIRPVGTGFRPFLWTTQCGRITSIWQWKRRSGRRHCKPTRQPWRRFRKTQWRSRSGRRFFQFTAWNNLPACQIQHLGQSRFWCGLWQDWQTPRESP